MIWSGPVEAFAHQNLRSVRKVIRRLLLLPLEGNVVYVFVPAEKNGIADGSCRSTHYTRLITRILRGLDCRKEAVPIVVMATVGTVQETLVNGRGKWDSIDIHPYDCFYESFCIWVDGIYRCFYSGTKLVSFLEGTDLLRILEQVISPSLQDCNGLSPEVSHLLSRQSLRKGNKLSSSWISFS